MSKIRVKGGEVRGGEKLKTDLEVTVHNLIGNQFEQGNLVMLTTCKIKYLAVKSQYVHRYYIMIGVVKNVIIASSPEDDNINVHWMMIQNKMVRIINTETPP